MPKMSNYRNIKHVKISTCRNVKLHKCWNRKRIIHQWIIITARGLPLDCWSIDSLFESASSNCSSSDPSSLNHHHWLIIKMQSRQNERMVGRIFGRVQLDGMIFNASRMFRDDGYECGEVVHLQRSDWSARRLCMGNCQKCSPDAEGRAEYVDMALMIWRSI